MGNRHRWGVVTFAALVSCAQPVPPGQRGPELESLLSVVSAIDGWQIADGPSAFTPESLWEFLDGGAPRYLAYGLEKMIHVRYQLGDDPLSSVSVEAYDMGSELGAFGIYSSIRPPGAMFRPWGADGYRSGTVAAAWKGAVFIHAAADDARPELIEMLESFVPQACERISGTSSRPAILDPLPTENLVPHSERYVATDLLGHSLLGGGVVATYEIDGRRGELFFSELENEVGADEALAALRRERERWAEVVDAPLGQAGFRFQDPGTGSGTVIRVGRHVAGIHGELPVKAQDDVLEQLFQRLAGE